MAHGLGTVKLLECLLDGVTKYYVYSKLYLSLSDFKSVDGIALSGYMR